MSTRHLSIWRCHDGPRAQNSLGNRYVLYVLCLVLVSSCTADLVTRCVESEQRGEFLLNHPRLAVATGASAQNGLYVTAMNAGRRRSARTVNAAILRETPVVSAQSSSMQMTDKTGLPGSLPGQFSL